MASASPRSQQTYKTNGAYVPKTPVGNREHVFTIPYKWETFHASGATTAMPHAEMHSRQSYTTNPNAHPMLTWQTIATPMAVGSKDSGWH